MRLTADRDDPDFNAKLNRRLSVYLNGERLERVYEADDQRGVAVVPAELSPGQLCLVDGEIVRRELRGTVVFQPNWQEAANMGFDTWMEFRKERFHQSMMDRCAHA